MVYYLSGTGRAYAVAGLCDQLYIDYPSCDPISLEDQICSIADNYIYERYYESPDEADANIWYLIGHAC